MRGRKPDTRDLFLAGIALGGIWIMLPNDSIGSAHVEGLAVGLLSGLSFALLTFLNKQALAGSNAIEIALVQNLVAALVLFPFAASEVFMISRNDMLLIGVLGLFCTAVSHGLYVHCLNVLSARTLSMIAMLEPVYGVFFAYIFIAESPSLATMAGGGLICISSACATLGRSSK